MAVAARAGRSNGSASKRKSSRGADVGAQLSAAKSKLEEHLMRIAQEEPSSPEPEQASTESDVLLFRFPTPIRLPPGFASLRAGRFECQHQSASSSCL